MHEQATGALGARHRYARAAGTAALMVASFMTAVIAWPAEASAQDQVRRKFKDKIHVVQKKPVLQKKRVELVPHFGVSVNDPLYRAVRAGVNVNYNISERLFVGGLFDWYDFGNALGGQTTQYELASDQTQTIPDGPVINWAGGVEVGFVPIFGKFAIFNSGIVFYDVTVTAGALWVNDETIVSPVSTPGIGGTFSIATHVFLNEWFSVNLELRETAFGTQPQGAASGVLGHVVTTSLGVGFYLPTNVEYATPEGEPEE